MQPRRDGRVRCSAWLGVMFSVLIQKTSQLVVGNSCWRRNSRLANQVSDTCDSVADEETIRDQEEEENNELELATSMASVHAANKANGSSEVVEDSTAILLNPS